GSGGDLMKSRATFVLLLAGFLGGSAGSIEFAAAQDNPICEAVTDAAMEKTFEAVLEATGAPESTLSIGQNVFDAWKIYLTSPSEERLNNTALSLTKSAMSALVPGAGVAIEASEGYIGGVKATIDEAEKLRMQNFVCGGSDIFDLPNNNFWEMRGVQAIAPGLTCENFGERFISYDQLTRLKALWEGEHSRRVKAFQTDSLETRDRLGQAWHVLQQQWTAKWAEGEYRRIRAELYRRATSQSQQCAAPAPVTAQPAPAPGQIVDVYANSESRITVVRSMSGITATEEWATGGRAGTNRWTNCVITHVLTCNWIGDYRNDPDKTAVRSGTLTAQLNGNVLTGTYLENAPQFSWRVQPYDSAMRAGAQWPINHTKVETP
ncbi:MAG TPA: hypothetical protein VI168_16590, partial [Croceibacterium sp.]